MLEIVTNCSLPYLLAIEINYSNINHFKHPKLAIVIPQIKNNKTITQFNLWSLFGIIIDFQLILILMSIFRNYGSQHL